MNNNGTSFVTFIIVVITITVSWL